MRNGFDPTYIPYSTGSRDSAGGFRSPTVHVVLHKVFYLSVNSINVDYSSVVHVESSVNR